jgi:hypothetical protein
MQLIPLTIMVTWHEGERERRKEEEQEWGGGLGGKRREIQADRKEEGEGTVKQRS